MRGDGFAVGGVGDVLECFAFSHVETLGEESAQSTTVDSVEVIHCESVHYLASLAV